eukprot:684933_1
MVYFWLYVNCMLYWKYCGIIYAMNILHVLYIHCRYGNEWKHYSKYNTNHEDGEGRDGSETVSKVSRLSNMVLKSQTNGFLFFSIIAGVPASLQLSKSRIYRHRIFSLPIADHFWMKLFRDIGFLSLLLIYYGILVIPAVRIVMDTDVVKDWNMACILLGTMVALCHIIYLVFKFRIKHYEYSDNHDVFQIKAHFKNALEREHIFTPVHTNYEKDMTKIIDSYLDNSTQIKYFSEVLDIDTHNHDLIISIFVSWKYEDDRLNGSINIAEIIEMEIDFREQLISEIRFARAIDGFGNKPSSNQEPPQISIEGKYSTEHLHSYQTGRFENKNDTDLQELKRNIFNEIKPLYTMTNADICNIIKYWFLSDIKYRAYNKDVMKIIRDKNVNGIVLQDLSTKKMNTKLYLSDLFGRYFEPEMIDVITKKLFPHETKGGKANETTDFVNLSTIDSYQLAKTICTLRMDRIGNRLRQSSDCIDGNWFTNAVNPKKPFMSKLIDELAINDEDAVQIYKLLKTFDVPKGSDIEVEIIEATTSKLSEDIKIDNIKQLSSEPFPINLETLALKLKNNLSLRQESEVLMNLFYHLVTVNATPDKPVNYGLYNHLYEIYASVFGQTCLNEWWCSECCYHNRRIKINSSFLNRDSPFMKACIICGTDKKTAIITTLKGESKQKCLMDVDANADEFSCEDGTIGKCIACQKIMEFLRKYEEHELDYPSILSTMNCTEVATHILVPSIQQLTDETDVLLNAFAINTIDGKLLCTLEEDVFRAMMGVVLEGNNQLSAGTVKHFYDLMYSQCDTYVKEARESIFGSSCSQLMHFWKHCLNKHMNSYSDDCSKNLFKCKEQQHADAIPEHAEAEPDHKSQEFDQLIQECAVCLELKKLDSCNDTRCVALSRNVDRFQLINSKSATTKSKARDSVYGELRIDIEKLPCNLHIKHQMQNDRYFQYELDSIHTHLLHDIHDVELLDLPFVKKASRKRESNKQSVIFAEPPVSLIELEELKEQGMANPTIPMNASHFKAMATEFASNKSKYTTDIGLYGFGIDHRHQYLKPAWDVTLNKAFNKKKQIIDKKDYVARQFNSDYNIHRGDPIGIHHLMAICFYTDFSRLCTDYRSTFRRVESKDSNDDDVRARHSHYYFFSRFLYESIEFFGLIMRNKQTVYHGLDKPFLFKDFVTHFNCPTSTTPDEQCARNFAKDSGIILALRNGNEETASIPTTIAQFMREQPRYLDVSWISAFQNEREYLFYGDNIIFKIHNIMHREVPRHTLALLTLLQRIIEGRAIDWDKENKKRISGLASKLKETREMNVRILQDKQKAEDDNKEDQQIAQLEEQLFKTKSHDELMAFAESTLQNAKIESKEKKAKMISGFKEYYIENQMDGLMFAEVSRKLLIKYMETQHGIRIGATARMHGFLKKQIAAYDKQIMDRIDAIEKEKIDKYEVAYHLKLLHYFTASRFDFICIRSLYNMPCKVQYELFMSEATKTLSLRRLSDMFSNTNHIAFTELTYDEMIRNCSEFCKSVRNYANDLNNLNKRLKYVVFKSVNVANSKYSTVLKKCGQKYQLQTSNISIRYSFAYKMNHILAFDIHSISVPSIDEARSSNNVPIDRDNSMSIGIGDYLMSDADDPYQQELTPLHDHFHDDSKEEEEPEPSAHLDVNSDTMTL